MAFGSIIKERRLELKLTQAQLAQQLDVAQNYVTYLEKGQSKPSMEMVKKLAKALSLSEDYLYRLSHPEITNYFPELTGKPSPLQPMLEELKKDKELRKKHKITDEEIEAMSQLRPHGDVRKKEDYLLLLMVIRQIFQN